MRRVVVVDADEEMGQAPPSPAREPARDELALLEDASRQLAARAAQQRERLWLECFR
jgi:hypothetical protein